MLQVQAGALAIQGIKALGNMEEGGRTDSSPIFIAAEYYLNQPKDFTNFYLDTYGTSYYHFVSRS